MPETRNYTCTLFVISSVSPEAIPFPALSGMHVPERGDTCGSERDNSPQPTSLVPIVDGGVELEVGSTGLKSDVLGNFREKKILNQVDPEGRTPLKVQVLTPEWMV